MLPSLGSKCSPDKNVSSTKERISSDWDTAESPVLKLVPYLAHSRHSANTDTLNEWVLHMKHQIKNPFFFFF